MKYVHILMALCATWRLTEVVGIDTIFEPVRKYFQGQWLKTFWSCPKCISVWMATICTLVYIYFPFLNWPFALSLLYMIVDKYLGVIFSYIQIKKDYAVLQYRIESSMLPQPPQNLQKRDEVGK